MTVDFELNYNHIRSGGIGFYEQKRGLIAVWGSEAGQFLDGLISNDVKTLEDGAQMLAAFPNAQGRLLAVVRVLMRGGKYLFETEESTREKIFNNLFRFTYAGDFFVEDWSGNYRYFELFGSEPGAVATGVSAASDSTVRFTSPFSTCCFIPVDTGDPFRHYVIAEAALEISAELYEVLRIENGIPIYGVDMDESTIVPELGIDGLISYNKGCYIGQEIIARIHFRGHVAKRLTGLVIDGPRTSLSANPESADRDVRVPPELVSIDGTNAGRITSVTFSPKLGKTVALAFVRYDYLTEGTKLSAHDKNVTVTNLPFIN